MWIIRVGKQLNRAHKARLKEKAGRYLSPVRRIERVAPFMDRKWVAMTFDDGPTASPANPPASNGDSLTESLLNTLAAYDAKGTFDVIGTTEDNYPDAKGSVSKADWGGIKYDHYPNFGSDHEGGIKYQKQLTARMVDEGHEVANHSYRHMIFGPKRIIYGKRAYFADLDEVMSDLRTLHHTMEEDHGYQVKLSRPPHYIDKISGSYDAYNAYQWMGYNYMAASYDGGGWLPTSGDYNKDVTAMIKPMEKLLKEDADAFNGQIIFQKDGYNMSEQSPVVDALPRQLEILKSYGYEIVTVSELIEAMPFEDIEQKTDYFEAVKNLGSKGYCIGYKNNTFQPDRVATIEELYVMVTPPKEFLSKEDPYRIGAMNAVKNGLSLNDQGTLTYDQLSKFIKLGWPKLIYLTEGKEGHSEVLRRDLVQILSILLT